MGWLTRCGSVLAFLLAGNPATCAGWTAASARTSTVHAPGARSRRTRMGSLSPGLGFALRTCPRRPDLLPAALQWQLMPEIRSSRPAFLTAVLIVGPVSHSLSLTLTLVDVLSRPLSLTFPPTVSAARPPSGCDAPPRPVLRSKCSRRGRASGPP